jgi:hypothetical protein
MLKFLVVRPSEERFTIAPSNNSNTAVFDVVSTSFNVSLLGGVAVGVGTTIGLGIGAGTGERFGAFVGVGTGGATGGTTGAFVGRGTGTGTGGATGAPPVGGGIGAADPCTI